MNNEIKQLCEQAKAYANESTKEFIGDEPVVWMDYYTEKFAQLIIKECIKQARKDENSPAYEAVGRIAEHFGIE